MANEVFNIGRMLMENKGRKYSIRQISLERKINYKSAYQAVEKLGRGGTATLEKGGNTTLCSFSNRLNPLVYEVEYARRGEALKNKDLKILTDRLNSLSFPLIALLFGSYAKKRQDKHSDIDLLVVCDNKEEVERMIAAIPLKIHLNFFSYKEFGLMLLSKEFSVASEAMNYNIILIGIEDYYRLVEYAGSRAA